MIYLDCAATSMQKPSTVCSAMQQAVRTMASPGRGGHEPAERAAKTAFQCRMELADLFHVPEAEQVVFTFNATHALNIAIHDLVSAGDKVVVSGYEHNSVMRPLYQIGADVKIVRSLPFDDDDMLMRFEENLNGAKAAVCTAMSNVFGYIMPIKQISHLCKEKGIPLVIDVSQLAGCGELDFTELGAAYMAMPGHKGLLGPQGTGVLLCGATPKPLICGGSGSESRNPTMPEYLPDRLEAGTHNIPGIAGLLEGVRYIRRIGVKHIAEHEHKLMTCFAETLGKQKGLETFYASDQSKQGGVLSIRHSSVDSQVLAEALGNHGIAVRGGLHCAPSAHESAGTLESGTVRFSFSPFLTFREVEKAARITTYCMNNLKT